ncbi:MAG: hypothetical protein KF901_21300 [Myxococcales bacterium]|nr:hypothetical protein [Myxococcales bacterium]
MSPRSRGGSAAVANQRAHGPAAEGPAPSPSDSSPRFPTLEALCAARARETGPQATCAPGERFAPPTPTAALRELAVIVVHDPDEQQERGYLVLRGDAGWRQVALVTTTDDTDAFGRLEVSETVHTVRFAERG